LTQRRLYLAPPATAGEVLSVCNCVAMFVYNSVTGNTAGIYNEIRQVAAACNAAPGEACCVYHHFRCFQKMSFVFVIALMNIHILVNGFSI